MSTVLSQVLASTSTDGQIINVAPAVGGDVNQVGGNPSLVTLTTIPITLQTQKPSPDLENEKQAIYRHPLFPLMALLFEKCEALSQISDSKEPDCFDADIQTFVHHQEREKQPFFSDNEELDGLMLKAIQVLRIHLLELEKVNDLCKDFCNRYITCLKGKLQSENLLRTESDYDQSMFDEPPPEESMSPVHMQPGPSSVGANVLIQPNFQSNMSSMPALGPGQIMSGGTVYQMVQTPQGLVAQPIQIQPQITTLTTPLIHGSTPLSQIGVGTTAQITSPTNSTVTNSFGSVSSAMDSDDDEDVSGKKKSKRGVLPKSATQVMKSWLFQHIVHPYPTEDEKRQIASQTNLTLLQVNNWFINARRRILQPMLDASNPEQSKAKKAKHTSRPPQRFWPFTAATAENSESEPNTTAGQSITTTAPVSAPSQNMPGQTIILGPGSFITANGQIVNLQQANMAAMLEQVRQTSSSPIATKDINDTNNNSNNTEEDYNDEDENERSIKEELT